MGNVGCGYFLHSCFRSTLYLPSTAAAPSSSQPSSDDANAAYSAAYPAASWVLRSTVLGVFNKPTSPHPVWSCDWVSSWTRYERPLWALRQTVMPPSYQFSAEYRMDKHYREMGVITRINLDEGFFACLFFHSCFYYTSILSIEYCLDQCTCVFLNILFCVFVWSFVVFSR